MSDFPGPGDFYLGLAGAGSLTIDSGSSLTTTDYGLIGYAPGSSGTVTVTGSGSALTVNASNCPTQLSVGYQGHGALNIENGGFVNVLGPNFGVGLGFAGATGVVDVTGPTSRLNSVAIAIGQGAINVSAGASVKSSGAPIMIIGDGVAPASLRVDGSGSNFTSVGKMAVGYNGFGEFALTNGASATTSAADFGYVNSTGVATVAVGSTWQNAGLLNVGYGGSGTIDAAGGSQISTGGANLGVIEPGPNVTGNGKIELSGVGTNLVSSGNVNVGFDGVGTLNILNGATVTSGLFDSIGTNAGSSGTATVSGAGSLWKNTNNLFVGSSGSGTLNVTQGGAVKTSQGGYVGFGSGGTDVANVDGTGSSWNIGLDGWVGFHGKGALNITNGGSVTVGSGGLNIGSGAAGAVLVDDGLLASTGGIVVGLNSGGTLDVRNAGFVSTSTLRIGTGSGDAAVTMDGGALTTKGDVFVGADNAVSAQASLTVKNGGGVVVNSGAGTIYLGNGSGGAGTLNIGGAAGGSAEAPAVVNAAGVAGLSAGSVVQFNTTSGAATPYYFSNNGQESGQAMAITGAVQIVNNAGYNILTGANAAGGGVLVNGGTLGVASSASLMNNSFGAPTVAIGLGGALANDGEVTNAASFVNQGTVTGAGSFVQSGGSTINAGLFSQGSLTVNGGTFTQQGAGFTNITGDTLNSGSVILQVNTFANGGTFTNAGTLEIDSGATLMTGGVVQTGGSTLLNNGTIDPPVVEIDGGSFGGSGIVDGNLDVTGGKIDVGAGLAGALAVNGAYDQTGGTIVFDILAGGGFFTNSMLVLDGIDPFKISNSTIEFDFLGGANEAAFQADGLFNLATFFGSVSGNPFGMDYPFGDVFLGDTFTTNLAGVTISGFDASSGDLLVETGSGSVPEAPSTLGLFLLSALVLATLGRRKILHLAAFA